ncbi:MAG: hypothetical protein U0Z75_00185 [Deinococcaceae bacterium]
MIRPVMFCLFCWAAWCFAQPSGLFTLKLSPVAQRVTVSLNSESPIEFQDNKINLQDISSKLKSGPNTIQVGWKGLNRSGNIAIRSKDGEVLFNYPFDDTKQPPQGNLKFILVIDKQHSLANTGMGSSPVPKLEVKMASGILSLVLNGQTLGDYAGSTNRFLYSLRDGANTLKVRWSKDFGSSLPVGALELKQGNQSLLFWNTDQVRTLQGEALLSFRVY